VFCLLPVVSGLHYLIRDFLGGSYPNGVVKRTV
jgi:hypothetical protein